MGNLLYTDDFQMKIFIGIGRRQLRLRRSTLTVPLYTVMKVEDFSSDNPFLVPWIEEGNRLRWKA